MKATAGMLFLLGLILPGCDLAPAADEAASTRAHIDLGALRQASAKRLQEECAWVTESVALTVVAGTDTTILTERIPEPTSRVTIPVRNVQQGDVQFSVEIFSNNNTLLYGTRQPVTQTVDEDFQVNIGLRPRAPVMEVCPRSLVLDPNNIFKGTFTIFNNGVGPLAWDAPPAIPGILVFTPLGGTVASGDSTILTVMGDPLEPLTRTFRITSPEGSVPISIQLAL